MVSVVLASYWLERVGRVEVMVTQGDRAYGSSRYLIIAVFGAIGLTEVSLVIGVGSCDRLWEKVCADENDSIGHYVTIVQICKLELASLTLLFTTILTLRMKVNYAFHAQKTYEKSLYPLLSRTDYYLIHLEQKTSLAQTPSISSRG